MTRSWLLGACAHSSWIVVGAINYARQFNILLGLLTRTAIVGQQQKEQPLPLPAQVQILLQLDRHAYL